jgi:hypothetical protein
MATDIMEKELIAICNGKWEKAFKWERARNPKMITLIRRQVSSLNI